MNFIVKKNVHYLAGIDEVGRGPIAGPVAVCVFCIEKNFLKEFKKIAKQTGITDSKKLTSKKRESIAKILCDTCVQGNCFFHINMSPASFIDRHGIVPAIKKSLQNGLQKSLDHYKIFPKEIQVFLDGGLHAPEQYIFQQTIIKGDTHNLLISSASILAKVHRDRYMTTLAKKYPEYHWDQNKGYGTTQHYQGVKKHGTTKIHRKSFLS